MNDAFRFADAVLHLDGAGPIARTPNSPDRWSERNALPDHGHLVTVFTYTEPWSYRERHPGGDELVALLAGMAVFAVEDERVELHAGDACIVPTGAWHGLVACETATLMFFTPEPAHTEHRSERENPSLRE
jgi:quercetin dioxygenase-like cupin family protein